VSAGLALLAFVGSFGAGTARAASFRAEVAQTFGPSSYSGTSASLEVGRRVEDLDADVSIRPSANLAGSNSTAGTSKSYALRLGFDTPGWTFGMSGGFSPELDGYRTHNVGFDLDLRWDMVPFWGAVTPLEESEVPVEREEGDQVSLGGGLAFTTHADKISAFGPAGRLLRSKIFEVTQTDLSLTAGLTYFDVSLSGQVTWSRYDQDLKVNLARPGQRLFLSGLAGLYQGFPDRSVYLKLGTDLLPRVSPYLSFNRTTYQLDAPTTVAWTGGASVDLSPFQLGASVEVMDPGGGQDKQTYLTLEGAFSF